MSSVYPQTDASMRATTAASVTPPAPSQVRADVEAVARVLARCRLGYDDGDIVPVGDYAWDYRRRAENLMWPRLVREAAAAIEAVDRIRAREAEQQAEAETAAPRVVEGEELPIAPTTAGDDPIEAASESADASRESEPSLAAPAHHIDIQARPRAKPPARSRRH